MDKSKELMSDQERDASLVGALLSLTQSAAAAHFSVYDLEARNELLEGYWTEFQRRDYILQRYAESLKEATYFKSGVYGATLSNYLSAKAWFRQRIREVTARTSNEPRNDVTSTQASLEKMKLPTFDGDHRDWDHFKDKFTALIVKDTKMDPIVKMQHLNNCLGKEPAEKLKSIKFTGENFLTAWQALCSRYDNNYLRFSVQMEALIKMPSATTEQVSHLCQLINTVDDSINTFTALGRPKDYWDDIFVYHVESKLAESTRRDWGKEMAALKIQDGFAKYADIKKFIEGRIRDLDIVEARGNVLSRAQGECSDKDPINCATSAAERKHSKQKMNKSTGAHVATHQESKNTSKSTCSFCKGNHFLGFCNKFSACSQIQRRSHAASAKLCFNCLNSNHSVDTCQSKGRCLVCGSKHHTKLHQDAKTVTNASATVSEDNEAPPSSEAFMGQVSSVQSKGMSVNSCRNVLLATACVLLQGPNGQTLTARALLDSGAEESFLTEHVVQALALRRNSANVIVSGVGGSTTAVARSRVSVILKSRQDSEFCFNLSALVLKKLSALIPSSEVRTQSWAHLAGLELADPYYDAPSRIDCILNSAVYAAALLPGIRKGPSGMPIALNSVFGWVLMGTTGADNQQSSTAVQHITVHELSQAVAKFWEHEEVPTQPILSPAELECVNHFNSTHSRNQQGRFIVRLPFAQPPKPLNTRGIAEACLKKLERRFAKEPELFEAYRAFMREYLELGHMEVMSEDGVRASDTYYMPHHPVFKKDSKRLRVVFNASQKNAEGISLNSFFHVGPKLQEDGIIIIVQWAFHRVVFKCDVKKMFRQFLVNSEDADWQRIVWRESPDQPIMTYRLITVTYGTVPAPFIANACMMQLAKDEKDKYPEGAKVLVRGRFVDDFFAGADSEEEANIVLEQLIGILKSAGMHVGKWAANRSELLADLPSEEQDDNGAVLEDQDAVSTLGLRWLASEDAFCFKISPTDQKDTITKRSILSETAKLYDPVGWLSPVIVTAKILLQNLWLRGVDWDDAVPEDLKKSWITFRNQLKDIELIRIPRWYGSYKDSPWELHCFCDASERAYAVVLYAVIKRDDRYMSSLITAKSKVSPIKVLSLPRLELCGAFLLSRLVNYLVSKLERKPTKIYCWTDSKIVLAWLRSHPSRWKSFIANRVSEIVTSLPDAVWGHVVSADNPADLATRGLTPISLKDSAIWWKGPEWLQHSPSRWPAAETQDFQTSEEARKAFATTTEEDAKFSAWALKFSSFDKIVRILAYIHRWKMNAKKESAERRLTWLSANELSVGRTFLVRLIQRDAYKAEIEKLRTSETVSNSSTLCRLSPFLDINDVMRVGGRLQNSFLSEEEKHPIILPGNHHAVRLLICKAHKVTLHGGPTLVQSHLARQYWIVRGRNVIRGIIKKCVLCARHRATTIEQKMGPLPAVRTRPARPFTFTGVDFAGPFSIRCSAGRGQKSFKGYVSIFVCLVVRAVHIEVVSDLTSSAFLAAFRRFTARRGLCQVIFSDNGRNFQGADAELRRMFNQTSAMSQEIAAVLAHDQVEWKYIPPRAPNFGGLWEANVKSFKGHLRKVIGESKLTFEEFYTVCSSIEACLNSRPLSVLSTGEPEVAALTPGHFLIGAPLTASPEPFIETNEAHSACSRWQILTLMRNHFWKRWQREFLLQAQQRSKWLHPNRSFKVGDVVLFKDELMPPTKWPLARITKLYQGPDGLSRVACIRTAAAEFKRPVNKLIWLPSNEEASSHLALLRTLMIGGGVEDQSSRD